MITALSASVSSGVYLPRRRGFQAKPSGSSTPLSSDIVWSINLLLSAWLDVHLSPSFLPFCPRFLGNGIAALHSVPTAIFCVLHCLQPRESLPQRYGGLERTMAYSLALGGDTDTIACMAGAIAGAHYGIEVIPEAWMKCCEGVKEAEVTAQRLHVLYHQRAQGGASATGRRGTTGEGEEPGSGGGSGHVL